MVEQGTRVDRLVSIDVVERFEALQDEVDLMKNEIKQTLVDLREHMMKGRTVFSQAVNEPPHRTPATLPTRMAPAKEPSSPNGTVPSKVRLPMPSAVSFGSAASADGMDPMMLSNIICWLGTVKQRGLSLQQVTPFLEAYEASGYLPPIMLKVLLRSLADLDQLTDSPPEMEFSPEQYSQCISELHDIICSAEVVADQAVVLAPEIYEEDSQQVEASDDHTPNNLNGSKPDNAIDPSANGYHLTTIQVPEFQEDSEFGDDGGLNG